MTVEFAASILRLTALEYAETTECECGENGSCQEEKEALQRLYEAAISYSVAKYQASRE